MAQCAMLGRLPTFLLAFLIIFKPNFAFSRILPTFENGEANLSSSVESIKDEINQFQILVFPHRGTYTTPQGRESKVSSIKVMAGSTCKKFNAKINPETNEWIKSGNLIQEEKQIALSITHPGPFYFECENGFKVIRDANLKAYSYSGNFVSRVNSKSIQVINIISPEEYLKGVVPAEVVPTWPDAVLRAQAIAARTYAWWSVIKQRGQKLPYDMDDTVQYQAYIGTNSETEASTRAITDTKNLVLRYQGQIIKAYFSADSGGYTESSESPFKEALPYCTSKSEEYSSDAFVTEWDATISLSKIKSTLAAQGLIPQSIQINQIEVKAKDRNESGRAKEVTLISTTGKQYSVDGAKFRLALKLRSTLFNVSMSKKTSAKGLETAATISGKGHGHGVGMSQKGALAYVQEMGWTHEQVLLFYYSGVTLSE